MATFDFSRFDPNQFSIRDPIQMKNFGLMVKELFNVIRTNPASLTAHMQEFDRFMSVVVVAFPVAQMFVPELRYLQSYPCDGSTALDRALRATKHKRPRAAPNSFLTDDQAIVRGRVLDHMEYIETGGHGRNITAKDRAAVEKDTAEALTIMDQPLAIRLPESAQDAVSGTVARDENDQNEQVPAANAGAGSIDRDEIRKRLDEHGAMLKQMMSMLQASTGAGKDGGNA